MKRLYLLRHSKAGHTNKKILDDHERTLTEKGVGFCADIARHLRKFDPLPEQVLCSTAVRAKQTTELVLAQLGKELPIEFSGNLYLATPGIVLSTLRATDKGIDSLLVVGHNPGLQEFALMLAGSGDKKKFRAMRSAFPPPSLAVFDLDVKSWRDIAERSGVLVDFHAAKKPARKAS